MLELLYSDLSIKMLNIFFFFQKNFFLTFFLAKKADWCPKTSDWQWKFPFKAKNDRLTLIFTVEGWKEVFSWHFFKKLSKLFSSKPIFFKKFCFQKFNFFFEKIFIFIFFFCKANLYQKISNWQWKFLFQAKNVRLRSKMTVQHQNCPFDLDIVLRRSSFFLTFCLSLKICCFT